MRKKVVKTEKTPSPPRGANLFVKKETNRKKL